MRIVRMFITGVVALTITTVANAQEIDWKKVDTTLGKTGAVAGEMFHVKHFRARGSETMLMYMAAVLTSD